MKILNQKLASISEQQIEKKTVQQQQEGEEREEGEEGEEEEGEQQSKATSSSSSLQQLDLNTENMLIMIDKELRFLYQFFSDDHNSLLSWKSLEIILNIFCIEVESIDIRRLATSMDAINAHQQYICLDGFLSVFPYLSASTSSIPSLNTRKSIYKETDRISAIAAELQVAVESILPSRIYELLSTIYTATSITKYTLLDLKQIHLLYQQLKIDQEDIIKLDKQLHHILSKDNPIIVYNHILHCLYSANLLKQKARSIVVTMATHIYNEFVSNNANRQVNISAKQRIIIANSIASGIVTKDLFIGASDEIVLLMHSDSFKRFLKSKLFQQLLNQVNAYGLNDLEFDEIPKNRIRAGSLHPAK